MKTNTPDGGRAGTSLYDVKPWFVRSLEPVRVGLLRSGIAPTAVTIAAIPVEIAVAVCHVGGTWHPIALLLVPPLTLAWMGLNALDGSLARSSGRTSTLGAVLNELVDRLGDVVVIVAAFLLVPTAVAAIVAIGVLGTELVAAIGWATTGHRRFAGPMGKPDRAITLALGATVAVVWWPAMSIALGAIGVGSLVGLATRTHSVIAAATGTGGER